MKSFASLRLIVLSFVLLAACQPVEPDDDYPNTSAHKAYFLP